MNFDNNEKNRLLFCIIERIETLRKEATTFKEIKETALKGEPNDDMVELINSCDNLINSHQKEYIDLIKLREKICKDEDEEDE